MTNPMLAELDEVVRQLHEVDGKEGLVLEKMRMLSTAGLFIKANHATLADMAKRLEAAERDAAILRNARIHLPTKVATQKLGDYSPEEMAAFDAGYNMALDRAHNMLNRYPGAIAAIDATQEGGG